MKIAIVSSTIYRIPPIAYSGLENIAWWQALYLSKLGHDITVVAPNESKIPDNIKFIPCGPEGIHEKDAFETYKNKLSDVDIIIDNSWLGFPYLLGNKKPVIHVFHAGFGFDTPPPNRDKPCFVGISKWYSHAIFCRYGKECRTVYHGLPLDSIEPRYEKEDFMLYISVLNPAKGADIAIKAAVKAKRKIVVCGEDKFVVDQNYVRWIKELSSKYKEYVDFKGAVDNYTKFMLMRKAKLLILPIHFSRPEFYGIVYMEALASGTPIISTPFGSIFEIREFDDNGKNIIFLCPDIDTMVNDIDYIWNFKSSHYEMCRRFAEKHMDVRDMAKNYEKLCKEVLDNGGW